MLDIPKAFFPPVSLKKFGFFGTVAESPHPTSRMAPWPNSAVQGFAFPPFHPSLDSPGARAPAEPPAFTSKDVESWECAEGRELWELREHRGPFSTVKVDFF